MNFAVKIFKGFAAMPDHRTGEGGQRFFRNFDRTGNEKFIVRRHGRSLIANTRSCRAFVGGGDIAALQISETPYGHNCDAGSLFLLNKTDVAAALDARDFYF